MRIKYYSSVFCNLEDNFEKRKPNPNPTNSSPLWILGLKNYLCEFLHSAHLDFTVYSGDAAPRAFSSTSHFSLKLQVYFEPMF